MIITNYKKSGWFVVIITTISIITTSLYGFIATMFVAFVMYYENYHIHDIIFPYLVVFICCLFPLPLAIYAHINKRHIEKYFHLGYMIFAPIIIVPPYFGFTSNIKNPMSIIPLIIVLLILCIPFIFLKNCYLFYRHKKLNTLESIEKDLEVSTKVAGEIATQGNLSKGLVNNEEISNLDKFLGFIQCGVASAVVGVIVGAVAGVIIGSIVGAVVGAFTGAMVGATRCAIVGAMVGVIVGASARFIANFILDFL